jgi:UDP-N-acetylmuramyl tripeptide synthase
LISHELIKIRVFNDDREVREQYLASICEQLAPLRFSISANCWWSGARQSGSQTGQKRSSPPFGTAPYKTQLPGRTNTSNKAVAIPSAYS